MKKNELALTELPLKELLKRTFSYVWNDSKIWLQILLITIGVAAIQLLISFIPFCDNPECNEKWQANISSTLFMIANVMILIYYCRKIVLKKETDFTAKYFWKAVLFYIIATIVAMLAIILPVVLCGALFAVIFNLASSIWLPLFIVTALIVMSIWLAPLLLAFPSIAVEDYSLLNLKKLFSLTRNCHNKIFWGMFLAMLPCSLILLLLVIIYSAIYGSEALAVSIAMPIVSLLLQLLNSYIKGSYYSHLYQFFKFVDKKSK